MPDGGAYILTNFLTAGQTTIIITERTVPYICVGMLPTNLLFFRSATETRPMNQFCKLYKIENKHAVQPRSHDRSSSCSGAPLFPPRPQAEKGGRKRALGRQLNSVPKNQSLLCFDLLKTRMFN